MKEVKNKQGQVIGSYEEVSITKPDTYVATCVNKDGQEITYTKEVSKEDILALATRQFNTNVRNYVAGLAREKKDSKLALMKAYLLKQGIDVTKPVEDLKKDLGI